MNCSKLTGARTTRVGRWRPTFPSWPGCHWLIAQPDDLCWSYLDFSADQWSSIDIYISVIIYISHPRYYAMPVQHWQSHHGRHPDLDCYLDDRALDFNHEWCWRLCVKVWSVTVGPLNMHCRWPEIFIGWPSLSSLSLSLSSTLSYLSIFVIISILIVIIVKMTKMTITIQRWRWRTLHPSVLQQAVHLCHLPQRAWVRGPDDHGDDHDADDYHDQWSWYNHHHDDNHYDDHYYDCHQVVHKYIGQEPSGRNFNEICLDKSGKFFTRQVWQVFLMDKSVKFFNGGVWQVLLLDKSSKFFYFTSLASGNRSCSSSIMNEHHIWIHLNLSVKLHNFSKLLPLQGSLTSQPDWIKINDKV